MIKLYSLIVDKTSTKLGRIIPIHPMAIKKAPMKIENFDRLPSSTYKALTFSLPQ